MRRRRQKNNLLPKMIGLAVLINAILLPILAQFGVFKSIGGGQRLTPIELVKLPPVEKRPAPPKKAPKKAAKPHSAGRKVAARPASARRVPAGPPPVKVVAAASAPGAVSEGGGDSGIASSDSLPTPVPTPAAPGPGAETPLSVPLPVAPNAPLPIPAKAPLPVPSVPVLTVAVPLSQPRPEIPDDLRAGELNATFEGLFTVYADGTATVKQVSGTGDAALDALALDAARRWTFRPATRDGQPVQSFLRLQIQFEVRA